MTLFSSSLRGPETEAKRPGIQFFGFRIRAASAEVKRAFDNLNRL